METFSDPAGSLVPRLEGFEGPLHLLPDLARLQKVDLSKISVMALANTLLASLEMARGGILRLRQDEAFGPILLRQGRNDGGNAG